MAYYQNIIDGTENVEHTATSVGTTPNAQFTIVMSVSNDLAGTGAAHLFNYGDGVTGAQYLVRVIYINSGPFRVQVKQGIGGTVILQSNNPGWDNPGTINQILISCDLSVPTASFWMGTSTGWVQQTFSTLSVGTIDWGVTGVAALFKSHPLGNALTGTVADLWIDDSYIDFDIEANRSLFYEPDQTPVYLGADGERPTGSSPLIFYGSDMRATNWTNDPNRGTTAITVKSGAYTDGNADGTLIPEPVAAEAATAAPNATHEFLAGGITVDSIIAIAATLAPNAEHEFVPLPITAETIAAVAATVSPLVDTYGISAATVALAATLSPDAIVELFIVGEVAWAKTTTPEGIVELFIVGATAEARAMAPLVSLPVVPSREYTATARDHSRVADLTVRAHTANARNHHFISEAA